MKILRSLVILILAAAITFGLYKWYQQEEMQNTETVSIPFWNKLAERFNTNNEAETKTGSTTDTAEGNVAIITDTPDDELIAKEDLHEDFSFGSLTDEQVASLLTNNPVHGNPSATVIFMQFCDYTTSKYCKEFFDQGSIFDYQEMLQNNLGYIFKGFPTSLEDDVTLPHRAMICAINTSTTKQVLSFHNALYTQAADIDENIIGKIANDLGMGSLNECINNPLTLVALKKDMIENKDLYTITALPTHIVINTISGKRVKIPGTYPNEDIRKGLLYVEQLTQ